MRRSVEPSAAYASRAVIVIQFIGLTRSGRIFESISGMVPGRFREEGPRPGPGSGSIYAMCPEHRGRRKKLPILMMTQRVNGGNGTRGKQKKKKKNRSAAGAGLATGGKNRFQFLWRNDFELGVCAVAGFFVRSPSAELRRMPEAASLHVVVSDLHHKLGSQRFPR